MTKEDAANLADSLIVKLIESQPNMVKYERAVGNTGREAAEFIAALRTGLIEMYLKQS